MLINGRDSSEMSLAWCAPKLNQLGASFLVFGEIIICNAFLFFCLGLEAFYFFFWFSLTVYNILLFN